MTMQRRTFLQLLGGSFVALAIEPVLPRWALSDTAIDRPEILVDDIFLYAAHCDAGLWEVGRPGSLQPILHMPVARGGWFRWQAVLGHEIVVREGEALEIHSPGELGDWRLSWSQRGKRFSSGNDIPVTAMEMA